MISYHRQLQIKKRQSHFASSLPRILIADDEHIVRELFERVLSARGYSVSTAINGFDALSKIKKNNYDMLILDLKMPRIGGMKLLKRVKKLNKDLIIIIITGYATVDTAKEAMREGCFDYITKPFNIEEVAIVIKRAFTMYQIEKEKRQLERQLERSQRLASLAQMGAGVAHEVNTALASIKLFLEMLKPKSWRINEGKSIEVILEEVERAEKLIVRFLNFARPEEGEFIKIDITNVIKKSLSLFQYKFNERKIKVVNTLNHDMPYILGDPTKIEEIFLNLFSNSADAMPEGGFLTIGNQIGGKKIIITIKDTGIGIASQDIPKLFSPFFTTKQHGTGLGLSIVHRIVDEHKGIITITSEKNKGTTVRIEFPLQNTVNIYTK